MKKKPKRKVSKQTIIRIIALGMAGFMVLGTIVVLFELI
jgi:hypothetical protein